MNPINKAMKNKIVKPRTTKISIAISTLVLTIQIGYGQTITGTGSSPYVPKFSSASSIGNSQIIDNGTSVMIGGTTPLSGEYFGVRGNTNGFFLSRFYNASDGASAYSSIGATVGTSTTLSMSMTMCSSAYGASGMYGANIGILGCNGTGGMNLGTSANSQLSFWTNNTKRISITNAGLVGIGTASPAYPLDVVGSVNSTSVFRSVGTGANNTVVGWNGYNNILQSAGSQLLINYAGQDVAMCTGGSGVVSTGKNFEIGYPTRNVNVALNVRTDGTTATAMNLQNSAGTQLINVANDGTTLINSTASNVVTNTPLTISSLGGYSMKFYANGYGDMASNVSFRPHFGAGSNYDYSIYEGTTITGSDILRFKIAGGTGNVGIGTASPQSTLHVEGNTLINSSSSTLSPLVIKGTTTFSGDNRLLEVKVNGDTYARAIYVQTTAFPDYVFEKNYQLMNLPEVEKYIEANKHLPNVPSAPEVVSGGQNVGKIQVAQMEKIEELYLYVIEMNKKMQKLEEENGLLKKQMSQLTK